MSWDKKEFTLGKAYCQFLQTQDFYHADCTKRDAEKMLKSCFVDGAFLFRPKSNLLQQKENCATAAEVSSTKYVLSFSVIDENSEEAIAYHCDIGKGTVISKGKASLAEKRLYENIDEQTLLLQTLF